LSSFSLVYLNQVLVYGDCAVNTDPNSEQLARIGVTSAKTAAAFGIEPRVAFLSYSTLGSGAGPDVDKVGLSSASRLVHPASAYNLKRNALWILLCIGTDSTLGP